MCCLVWIIIYTWYGHGILCQSRRFDESLQETSCFGVNSYKGAFLSRVELKNPMTIVSIVIFTTGTVSKQLHGF